MVRGWLPAVNVLSPERVYLLDCAQALGRVEGNTGQCGKASAVRTPGVADAVALHIVPLW